MKKWEYKIVDSKDIAGGGVFKGTPRENIEAYLTKLGDDGWEVFNLHFKELEKHYEFYGVARREATAG